MTLLNRPTCGFLSGNPKNCSFHVSFPTDFAPVASKLIPQFIPRLILSLEGHPTSGSSGVLSSGFAPRCHRQQEHREGDLQVQARRLRHDDVLDPEPPASHSSSQRLLPIATHSSPPQFSLQPVLRRSETHISANNKTHFCFFPPAGFLTFGNQFSGKTPFVYEHLAC